MKIAAAKPVRPRREPAAEMQLQAAEVLAWLERHATRATLDGMARYAIPSDNALGVAMRDIQLLAKQLGRNHELALVLWETGVYEARLLTAYVDEPDKVTPAQMERWCRDFDNWAVCDTLCFALWDRSPHAWKKVSLWAGRRGELAKRAGFALLACLALHDKRSADTAFLDGLALVEREAIDPRNFVKKSISWALRAIGIRQSPVLRTAARDVAARLATSSDAAARWVGKDAARQLDKVAARRTVAPKPVKKQTSTKTSRTGK